QAAHREEGRQRDPLRTLPGRTRPGPAAGRDQRSARPCQQGCGQTQGVGRRPVGASEYSGVPVPALIRSYGPPATPQCGQGRRLANGYNYVMNTTRNPWAFARGFFLLLSLSLVALIPACSRFGSTDSFQVGHLAPRSGPDQAAGVRLGDA